MNIFNFEFRSKWRSAAIWSFSIALIIVVFMSLYHPSPANRRWSSR